MRKYILILGPLALAACSSEPAEEAAPAEPAATETAAPTVANGTAAGTFTVTAADGTVSTTTTNADWTYSDMAADGSLIEEGTWAVTDGKTCFTPTTEGREAMCWTESAPGPDGSFTATSDGGEVVTVAPQMAAAEEPAATE
ncbi:MAG: hypothetical protein KDE15_09070 [Erythrobacter sp.]|nr:hypothetical protein [Erythrobacter sp.]